jgi:hypothetical protein
MERRGISYKKRVADINRIYDRWVKTGLSNREIWRRYIYPVYAISERTYYNLLKAPTKPENRLESKELELFKDYDGDEQ